MDYIINTLTIMTTLVKKEIWIIDDIWEIIKEFMINKNLDWNSKTFKPHRYIEIYPIDNWKRAIGDKMKHFGHLITRFEVRRRTKQFVYVKMVCGSYKNRTTTEDGYNQEYGWRSGVIYEGNKHYFVERRYKIRFDEEINSEYIEVKDFVNEYIVVNHNTSKLYPCDHTMYGQSWGSKKNIEGTECNC